MRAEAETAHTNRSRADRFRAPGTFVQTPLVVRVTGTIREGRRGGWNAIARTNHTNAQRRRVHWVRSAGIAGYRCANRHYATLVTSIRSRANARRARLEREPFTQHLRLLPGREVGRLRKLRNALQQRIGGRVV